MVYVSLVVTVLTIFMVGTKDVGGVVGPCEGPYVCGNRAYDLYMPFPRRTGFGPRPNVDPFQQYRPQLNPYQQYRPQWNPYQQYRPQWNPYQQYNMRGYERAPGYDHRTYPPVPNDLYKS